MKISNEEAGISIDDFRYRRAMMLEQAKQNIQQLQQVKEMADRQERQRNNLVVLSDSLIKDSFDSQLQSKMDILYGNHSSLTKQLNFTPAIFNCGKEFDIYKLLELAKLQRSLTTVPPKCIEELNDPLCPSQKEDRGEASSGSMTNEGVTRKMMNNGVLSLLQMYGNVTPKIVFNVTLADKKNLARPVGKLQQQRLTNMKPPKLLDEEDTHEDPAEISEIEEIISDDQLNIIAKPVAPVGNNQIKQALSNNQVETATQSLMVRNSLPAIYQVPDQLSQVAHQELKNLPRDPGGIENAAKHEASGSNLWLQQPNIGPALQHTQKAKQAVLSTQDVEQQQIFRVTAKISHQLAAVDDNQNRSQVVNSNGIVPQDKMHSDNSGVLDKQLFELAVTEPVEVTVSSHQQFPQAITMTNQTFGFPLLSKQQEAVTAVQQQHYQHAKPIVDLDLQQQSYQLTSQVPTIAVQQQQAIFQHLHIVQPVAAASVFSTHQPLQGLAKQEGRDQVQGLVMVAQKMPNLTSIDVLSLESTITKSPFEPNNVVGKSLFWSSFGHMLLNTSNSASMEFPVKLNNTAMYVSNVHQSKEVPNKLEHNPKLDYMYYQY